MDNLLRIISKITEFIVGGLYPLIPDFATELMEDIIFTLFS